MEKFTALVTQFVPAGSFRARELAKIQSRLATPCTRVAPANAGEVRISDAWNDPDYLYTTTAKLAGYRAIVVASP